MNARCATSTAVGGEARDHGAAARVGRATITAASAGAPSRRRQSTSRRESPPPRLQELCEIGERPMRRTCSRFGVVRARARRGLELARMLVVVAVDAQQLPIAAVRRIVVVIVIAVVNGQLVHVGRDRTRARSGRRSTAGASAPARDSPSRVRRSRVALRRRSGRAALRQACRWGWSSALPYASTFA